MADFPGDIGQAGQPFWASVSVKGEQEPNCSPGDERIKWDKLCESTEQDAKYSVYWFLGKENVRRTKHLIDSLLWEKTGFALK